MSLRPSTGLFVAAAVSAVEVARRPRRQSGAMRVWTLTCMLCCGLALPAAAQDDDFDFGDTELEAETDKPAAEDKPAAPAPAASDDAEAEGDAEEPAPTEKAEKEVTKDEVSEEGLELTLEDRIKAVSRKTFVKAGPRAPTTPSTSTSGSAAASAGTSSTASPSTRA
jgi:hypothetical protein